MIILPKEGNTLLKEGNIFFFNVIWEKAEIGKNGFIRFFPVVSSCKIIFGGFVN